MKLRCLFGKRVSALLVLGFMGCAGNPSSRTAAISGGLSLDVAIQQAAERIETRLDTGMEVALINVRSPSDQFSEYVLTYLESILVNKGNLVVVDRANLDKIREEQGFQLSGEVSDESAKSIGRMLGAGAIVTGTLINIGDSYRLTLKAINVETATVAASYPADIANDGRMRALLGLAAAPAAVSSGQAQPAKRPAITQSNASVYKIGDAGLAGGIVFFDKGNNSGGWRYLEVAPSETEFKAMYAPGLLGRAFRTDSSVGAGKSNTEAFVVYFNARGGAFDTAAWKCDELSVNGFDDWFLPSSDELNWMYGNLHRKGLGDFQNAKYWSSTENKDAAGNWFVSVDFSDGVRGSSTNRTILLVRAIRQF